MSVPATHLPRVQHDRLLPCHIQTGILVVAGVLLTVMLRWDARGEAQTASSRPQEEKPPDFTSKSLGQWIEALKDKDNRKLLGWAGEALGPGGPYAKVAIPALLDAFNHKRPPERSVVASILAEYGPPVVPRLVQALKRPEAAVRAGAAEALGRVR